MKNKISNYSSLISTILFSVLAFITVFLLMPANGYIESPGMASDVSKLITIDGEHDQQPGSFNMTTVYLSKANNLQRLLSNLQPHDTFEPSEAIEGDGTTEEFDRVSGFMMTNSIAAAQIVAYRAADKNIEVNSNGIYISSISRESNFKNSLRVGDTITGIDNLKSSISKDIIDYLATKNPGDEITVSYIRDEKTKTADGKVILIPNSESEEYPNGRAGIGITFIDDISIVAEPETKINAEGYGGPSAGLMFSLQIYDQLTNSNLTDGQMIAGTGTIDSEGNVGEIGGIDKKIIAANNAGAKIFFAPYFEPVKGYQDTNYNIAVATAKEYAKDIKIIPVKTFDDAVNYLKTGEIIDTK